MLSSLFCVLCVAGISSGDLRLSGTVQQPDGQPAAGANVHALVWGDRVATVKTNAQGDYSITSSFLGHTTLAATSADGRLMGNVTLQAHEVRQRAAERFDIKLDPALEIEATVRQEGKPAADVLVGWDDDEHPLRTDSQGRVRFFVPVSETAIYLSAWDKTRGVGAAMLTIDAQSPLTKSIDIILQPVKSVTFKAVDESGRPAAAVKLSPGFAIGPIERQQRFRGKTIPACHGITDARGEWVCPWVAVNAEYLGVTPTDKSVWRDDGTAENRNRLLPSTLHLRRPLPVRGKVVVPSGVSPQGLLVQATSFGPRNMGTHSAARVAADGTFTLEVVSEHFFTISVLDAEWTSVPIHQVMCAQGEKPGELTIQVIKPQMVEVRVVAGKDATPVANVFIQGGYHNIQDWTDSNKRKRAVEASIRQSAFTNSDGYVRFAVQPGAKVEFFAQGGKWSESIEANPPKTGPFVLTFRKPFVDKLKVAGKIVLPPAKAGRIELHGIGADAFNRSRMFSVEVKPDGTFIAETDYPEMRLLAVDRVGKTTAWAAVKEESNSIVMRMVPVGSYGGIACDVDKEPMPHCEVTIFLQNAKGLLERKTKADAKGMFRFDDVPAEAPLRILLQPAGFKGRFLEHAQAWLSPGEARLDAEISFTETPSKKPAKPVAKISFAREMESRLRDAQIWHAPALVVAHGAGTDAFVQENLASPEQPHPSYSYIFPLLVSVPQLQTDEPGLKVFTSRGWSQPKPGEVMLIALSPDGKDLGVITVKTTDKEAPRQIREFLTKFEPARSSAAKAMKQAFEEAKKTNRSVILQLGGLRCGPCYLFARWVEKHHATLEKDFVVLKLSNLHDNMEEALTEWSIKPSQGIPWTAVLDANGKVLITCDGPEGNFGFPSDKQSIAYFRSMLVKGRHRLTDADLDKLLADLLPKPAGSQSGSR